MGLKMKKVSLFATALVLACLQAPAQTTTPAAAPAASVTVGAPKFMPEEISGLELKDLNGRAFRLSDLRGRVYVLNLWATWCGPCRVEIPGFNKLHADYSARGVEFVGLTTEDPELDGDKVRGFAREMGMRYRLGWVAKETARDITAWGPSARPGRFLLPQTVVVAADGQIVLHVRGYNPRVPDMVRAGVERALALPKPATDAAAPAVR